MIINDNLIRDSDDRHWAWGGSDKTIITLNRYRGGYVKVKPNTTYTFKKYGGGDRFHLVALKEEPYLGHKLIEDREIIKNYSLNEYTFLTKNDETYLYFYGNADQQVDLSYKLEEGDKSTMYIPHKDDINSPLLYPDKVGGGVSMGGNQTHLGRWLYAS